MKLEVGVGRRLKVAFPWPKVTKYLITRDLLLDHTPLSPGSAAKAASF